MRSVRSRTTFVVLAAMMLLTATAGIASAAPGDLDPTFDGDGIAIRYNPGSGVPARVVPLADGGIVASADCLGPTQAQVYDFCIYRFNADGSPDTTFDGDGMAQSDFGNTFDSPWAVAVQPDGKVVAAGECVLSSVSSFCVARYTTAGAPDTTFDGDGLAVTSGFSADGGDEAYGRAVVLQPDGRIVVTGSCSHNLPPVYGAREACAARYNTDGSLDSSFSGDGRALVDLGSVNDSVVAAGLQSDGSIVLGGSCPPASVSNFCLARLTASGSADGTFGVITTLMGVTGSSVNDIAIGANDQIIASGQCQAIQFAAQSICIARYTANGILDPTFDVDGTTSVLAGNGVGGNAGGTTVALQANGKILAANGCANPGFNDFCVVRFNVDGTLDASFGTNGIVLTPIEPTGNNDWATDVAVAANGRILAAGACAYPLCIARYGGDPITDTSAPQVTISIDAADAVAGTGWYNAATSGTNGVLVHVSAQDDTAVTNLTCTDGPTEVLNVSSASGSFVLADGQHSISCTASDGINPAGAGSGSSSMPVLASVDQVAPSVACASLSPLLLNQVVSSINLATVTDATSGTPLNDWFVSDPNTATPGLHNIAINPVDEAGNERIASCGYQVNYVFSGYDAPILSSSFDYVRAAIGKIIPFRFTVTDANGQPVNGITTLTLGDVAAAGTCTVGTFRTFTTADYAKGKVGLVSLGGGAYEFRWKAPRSDRNQCRAISLSLADGVAHQASIQFLP